MPFLLVVLLSDFMLNCSLKASYCVNIVKSQCVNRLALFYKSVLSRLENSLFLFSPVYRLDGFLVPYTGCFKFGTRQLWRPLAVKRSIPPPMWWLLSKIIWTVFQLQWYFDVSGQIIELFEVLELNYFKWDTLYIFMSNSHSILLVKVFVLCDSMYQFTGLEFVIWPPYFMLFNRTLLTTLCILVINTGWTEFDAFYFYTLYGIIMTVTKILFLSPYTESILNMSNRVI